MFWEKKLAQWADEVRAKANIPARLVLWNGDQLDFGTFSAPQVTLKVNSASALPLLLEPSLDNLGEAYVKGKIDIEGKLSDIINIGYSLARSTVTSASKLARVKRYFNHSKSTDKKAIQYHYDVSNEFYKLWLDENMVYSCAYFENGDEDLATAQIKKIDHILTKIRLQPGQRLLDIGCGWGALVLRAAQKFGAQCLGVTLSQNQFDLATARVKAAGLEDKIEIRLQDYREIDGQFDRITSVGMFEHVGRKNLPLYFSRIHDLLTDDGIAMNHGITSTDAESGETALGGGEFIDRYVFPDGELPHISLALKPRSAAGSKRLTSKACAGTMRARSISGRKTSRRRPTPRDNSSTTKNSASGACISPAARMRSSTTTCRSSRSCAARPGRARRRCRGRGAICTNTRCHARRRFTLGMHG